MVSLLSPHQAFRARLCTPNTRRAVQLTRPLGHEALLLHGYDFDPPVHAPPLWRVIGRARMARPLPVHQEPLWSNGKMLHEIALYRFGSLTGQCCLGSRCLEAIGIADNPHPGRG